MATNETNGISLRRLKTFLTNLKNIFAEKKHSHATSDITGLDTALSSKATLAQGNKADSAVQSVKIGTTEYKSGTTVTLPSYPTSLPASDVPSWAKQKTKPTYSKSEVGLGNVDNTADANKNVKYAISAGSASSASKATGVVDYNSITRTIQIGYSGDGISGDAIKFIAGYTTGNNSDVDAKIKDVSKDALKSWLGLGSLAYSSATIPTIPSSLPANGGNSTTVNGHTINADVPNGAKFTDTNTWRGIQNNLTSDSTSDSLSAAQGKVLKGLVDSKVTESQNVATDLNNIKSTGIHHISASTSNNPTGTHGTLFAEFNVGTPYQIWLPDNSNTAYKRNYTTSTSTWGSWTQLKFTDTNTWRPQPDWNATSGDAVIKNKPTIPSVGNGTVTITQNGTTKGTFTMNQGGNTTIALTDNNTTYSAATQSAQGLMSASDKKKLDGITSGANAVIKVMSATDYSKLTDTQKKNGTIYLVN